MKDKDVLEISGFKIPKKPYIVKFSNGEDLIIEYRTFHRIIEMLNDKQDIMLNTIDNSMINLNQIVSIKPLEQELDPEGSLLEKIRKLKEMETSALHSNKNRNTKEEKK